MQCNILLPESSFITMRDGLSSSRRWILEGFVSLSQLLIKWSILYFLDRKRRLKGNGLGVFTILFSGHTLEVSHSSGCSLSLSCSWSPRSQRWKTPDLAHRCLIHTSGCRLLLSNGSVMNQWWGGATGSLAQGLTGKCGRASCSMGLAETGPGPWWEGPAGLVSALADTTGLRDLLCTPQKNHLFASV